MEQSQIMIQNLFFLHFPPHKSLSLFSLPHLYYKPSSSSTHVFLLDLHLKKIITQIYPNISSRSTMASTLFAAPTFQGLRPLNKPTDTATPLFLNRASSSVSFRPTKRFHGGVKAELSAPLVISLSTGLSLFLGRFVFFSFQRENVAKQVPEQNGQTHFEAGDGRAKEYVSLLKSNDPVGFNIVDVLAWGSIGHVVAYYILATSSNGYDPKFF